MCGLRAEVVGGDEATSPGEKGIRGSTALFSFLPSSTISKGKKMQGESNQNSGSERKMAGRRAVCCGLSLRLIRILKRLTSGRGREDPRDSYLVDLGTARHEDLHSTEARVPVFGHPPAPPHQASALGMCPNEPETGSRTWYQKKEGNINN